MSQFTIVITPEGWTEMIEHEGRTITKRYIRTHGGSEGLDQAWEYEEWLSDDLLSAIDDRDPWEIMHALAHEKEVEEITEGEYEQK